MAIAASMLMFGTLRPLATRVTTSDVAQSARVYSSSEELHRTPSTTPHVVARNSTNHFSLRGHGIATTHKSGVIGSDEQASAIPIRVVVD